MADGFTCRECGATFTVPEAALRKYPGWVPSRCLRCRDHGSATKKGGEPRGSRSRAGRTATAELNLPLAEVLRRFTGGPQDGVFTDGACSGNPGPGGWGVVWVREGEIVQQAHGHEPQTTNNRMELTALIAGYRMLPSDAAETIWSDSRLCVQTINEWAEGWRRRGWRRKAGPIANLELVQQAYELAQTHPRVVLKWIKAHEGSRWNEYADALATAYLRDEL
jgi:ribonuclease HI